MTFLANLRRAKSFLEEQRRASLRGLSRELGIEGEELDELVEELVEVQEVARRDGSVLVWNGPSPVGVVPASTDDRIDRAPGDYTPKYLADKILRSKSAIEGERKQVTVFFADVKGSMELAEQLDPEEWHGILERFFEILTEGVHRFEGTVNQYTGDGIMALFGAPIAHEDHAQRACYAALHLQDALRSYADDLRRTHGLSFSTRIGLNSGDVVVGKIGDDLRMDYTAQGHTVGLAQRMEQRAAPDRTCLTQYTAGLVEGYFALRELGPFQLKGVAAPIVGYELAGIGELRTRLDQSRARGFSRFVGRASEVAALEGALDGATQGRGSVVGVVADAGVGKSRLCLEFVEQCRARGVAVYEAHCLSHGKGIPLLPVLELLRAFFGLHDDDSRQVGREKITGRLMLLDREFEPMLPLAFDVLGVADPGAPPLAMSPEERQREFLALGRRIVHARGAREPGVVLIDDVHWIDPASDAFLEAIAEIAPRTRTLLLLNFRPEYSAEWMPRSTYQRLPLHPLGDAAVDEILHDLLGGDPSLDQLPPLIRSRSGGNPFYVEEIVRNLREVGSLEGERGKARLVSPVEELSVPASVQSILGARIDRLDEREKHLLQTAAAIGRRFPERLLRAVSELGDEQFDDATRALRAGEFVYAEVLYPETEYAFCHPLTHEVAERSQLADRRRRVHAAVARELEGAGTNETADRAALLAHHWDEAGEVEPASRWHRMAAERIAGSNSAEAARHWQRVRALSDLVEDEHLAAELGQRSRLMILEYSWRLGGSEEEAAALLAEGEEWARRRGDDRALAELYNAFSMPAILAHGATARADDAIAKGLRHVAEIDDRVLLFALELRRYLMAQFRGQVDEMRATMRRVETFSREEMDAAAPLLGYDARALVVAYAGSAEVRVGNFSEGLAAYARGLALARESNAREVASWVLALQAECRLLQGDFPAAAALGREALRLGEEIESPLSIALAGTYLAGALVRQGRFAEALAVAERAVDLSMRSCRTIASEALANLALAQLGEGNHAAAVESADRAVTHADAIELPIQRAAALLSAARVAAAGDKSARRGAAAYLDQAERMIGGSGVRAQLPELWETRATLALSPDGAHSPLECLNRARELHAQFGSPLQVARIDTLLAGLDE